MKRLFFFAALALVPGCSCKPAVADDRAPADLATRGLVIDSPPEGASLTGAWTTVSGWADPAAVAAVFVSGAPTDGLYLPSGHVGVPTVAVTLRPDGRFFAPRVPLQDGEVTLRIVPMARGGQPFTMVTRTVQATQTSVTPATLVVDPVVPTPGDEATLRASTGADLTTSFQWDFDGDGTFDAEGATVKHTWRSAGRYDVVARTRVGDRWVSAASRVVVDSAAAVLASAPVDSPRRIFFLSVNSMEKTPDVVTLEDGGTTPRAFVAVLDGDAVKVFDPLLKPLFSLPGLSRPEGIARLRSGGFVVADTGHDRMVAFTSAGELDPTFGTNGAFPLTGPVSVDFQGRVLLADGSMLNCGGFESPGPCQPDDNWARQLSRVGAQRIDRIVSCARSDHDDCGELYVGDGRLFRLNTTSPQDWSVPRPVVDAVGGLDTIRVNKAVIDGNGRLHLYRWPFHEGPYALPYKATAVATDALGRLYVAGPGVIELRDFEPLK